PGAPAARVGRDGAGDLLGVRAEDDVRRHGAGREATVADRVQHVLVVLDALVEVRPVLVLRLVDTGRGAVRAGRRQRVAGAAALIEDLRAVVLGRALGELHAVAPLAATGAASVAGTAACDEQDHG